MSAIPWPSGLPQWPLFDGWSFTPKDNRSFFDSEIGPPLTSPNGTAAGGDLSCAFAMTTAEFAVFKTFFSSTLSSGSKAFSINDPTTGGVVVVKFGSDLWTISPLGPDTWKITMSLVELS